MPNYQNAKIYKVWSPVQNLVYYGSTTQGLKERLSKHLYNYKQKTNIASQLVLEYPDYKIELVEYYPCNNRKELCKKEGEYIKANECVNKQVAGRTMKEYYKDKIENYKEYNKKNKERIKQYYKEYYIRSKQAKLKNSFN